MIIKVTVEVAVRMKALLFSIASLFLLIVLELFRRLLRGRGCSIAVPDLPRSL